MSRQHVMAGTLMLCIIWMSGLVSCYYPVYILHGVLSNNVSMCAMARRINEMHPNTSVFTSHMYENYASLEPMWRQVDNYGKEFVKFSNSHPKGFHLIGYSQGGLVARALLEKFPQHNVRTFISLSAPQAGQYGTDFLHIFFPELALETAYKVFYTVGGQLTSVGNYWNDPHHQELYMQYSAFLPLVNNEVPMKMNGSYKHGLTKLQRMVLIGGPDDGVITPWQSSHFDYYDRHELIVDMKFRHVYLSGYLGLRDLDQRGRLKRIKVSGVEHHDWRKNLTVIDNYILPHLD